MHIWIKWGYPFFPYLPIFIKKAKSASVFTHTVEVILVLEECLNFRIEKVLTTECTLGVKRIKFKDLL